MKCDVCKEVEAKVHLTQIINGAMQKVDLCEVCAKEKGVSDPTGFSLADLLLGLGQSENTAAPNALSITTEVRCPTCGMTQSDFKKSGRLGCAHCYETFAEPLAALIKSMHKGEQHVGKRPGGRSDHLSTAEGLKALRRDLGEAVRAEKFEVAAELRDRIKKMEERLKKVEEGRNDPGA